MKHWYAVMCNTEVRFKSGGAAYGECLAVERIGSAGFEAFTPVMRVAFRARGGARTNVERLEPLFRGYCFARWGEEVFSHGRLKAWPEVWDVVRVGEAPRIITTKEIEAVRAVEAAMATSVITGDATAAVRQLLRVGTRVTHRAPVFSGFVGTITEEQRAHVLVLFDGALAGRPVKVKREDLEVAQ